MYGTDYFLKWGCCNLCKCFRSDIIEFMVAQGYRHIGTVGIDDFFVKPDKVHTINKSINHSITQSLNQLIDKSLNQSFN